jgi:hypothetical protein
MTHCSEPQFAIRVQNDNCSNNPLGLKGHWPAHMFVAIRRCLLACAALSVAAQILADNPGEFSSPCQYRGDGGKYRWAVKIDAERPPQSVDADQQLSPLRLFNWTGGRGTILSRTPRQGRENEWIQLTGKVTSVIIEGDGDIHVELMNVDGRSQAKAVVEIPAGRRWCPLRQIVFGWTRPNFPIVTARQELSLRSDHVISVIGKAFWDGQHAPAATTPKAVRRNRRTYDSTCSVWEVHPVMVLTVVDR